MIGPNTDLNINDLKNYNVIFVSSIIPPEHSGAGRRIYNFYRYLRDRGVGVSIITETKSPEKDNSLTSVNKITLGGKARKFTILLNFFYFLFQLLFVKKLNASTNTKHVIWLVSASPLTFAASIVFYLKGFKIITQNTLIGSDDPEFKYPGDFWGLKYKMKKLQYSLSGCITSISPALYNISKEHHPNCVMIPNPIELAHTIKQYNSNSSEPRKNILFVGKLGTRKGIDIVFQTINQIHKYDQSIQFTLVGPNEEADQFKSLFNNLPYLVKEKVSFTGYQNNTLPYFAKADIFFMPSRREGFGTVFLEAMAHGLPVVAKKIDGITDFIFGEDYPTVLDTENPKEYAETIISLIEDKKFYNNLSNKGLRLVQRFDQELIFEQYLNIIKG